MSKPKVLLLGTIDHATSFWQSHIDPLASTITNPSPSRPDFLSQCRSGTFNDVQVLYRTFGSAAQTGPIDAELISALPSSLKLIAHNGAGYDQLSTSALADRGIIACNVPTAVDDATADTAVFLLLGALRNFNTSMLALRRGDWRGNPAPSLGHDPTGKILGILGMGGIGRNFARKARALGVGRILYHNRSKLDDGAADGASYVDFDELLGQSDVLSIHIPLNPQTRHTIGAAALSRCKHGQVIINTARGAVIDEAALADALDGGRIGAVGLDVYEEEPRVNERLVANERALLLPHMGTWTVETQTRMEEWCIRNVEIALGPREGWRGLSVVPEHKELLERRLGE
ncbi:MAG: hypothetical protein M1828_004453 [Chrysothrix sp. TS-e1954]|nr:MAG: hypothetical protein M1828_004453 [Chrysothrix sp. TS-e1954]